MAEATGTDLIRDALYSRNRKMNIVVYARNIGVSPGILEAFIDGRQTLPPEVLQALTKELFPHAEFVPELDVLRPAMQEPARLLGVPPKLEVKLPTYQAGAAQRPPQPVDAVPEKPKRREGWLGSWL